MRTLIFFLPFSLIAASLREPIAVDGGLIAGTPGAKNPAITVFRGVPFAAPPVGELRWRAPQPVKPWQGVRKAEQFGSSCIQRTPEELKPWTYEFMTHNEISEDCLFLNVWTGAKSSTEKRPVLVYIYGGGFNSGSGQVLVYDGEALAAKGVLVVSMNYRVGVLGFLAHPELDEANFGILDQIAALRWIQANIARFGGDPAKVTIAGQSAGASSVHFLIASPLAKGLFHGAIAQSGSPYQRSGMQPKLAEVQSDGVKFAEAKGARSIADLRAMPWRKVVESVQGLQMRLRPVVDGRSLPKPYHEILAAGEQNDVPLMTGTNKDEYGASPNPDVTLAAYEKQARERYGDEFLKLYPATNDAEARAARNEAARDETRVSMHLYTRQRAKATKMFTYFWTHPLPGPEIAKYGAFHTSEVPYVFATLYMSKRPFAAADRKIAETMSSYWVNFVKTGDPNGKGLPRWAPVLAVVRHGEVEPQSMEVGARFGPIPVAGSPARYAFWERLLNK